MKRSVAPDNVDAYMMMFNSEIVKKNCTYVIEKDYISLLGGSRFRQMLSNHQGAVENN